MLVECRNEVEAQAKASSTMTIGFLEDAKDFEFSDDVFGQDAFFS